LTDVKYNRESLYTYLVIQGVSEIRVLILTSGRTLQFMKLFSITFAKFVKVYHYLLPSNFYQTSRFVWSTSLFFFNHENFNNLIFFY
jgi:hypothetical protein